MSSTAFTTKLTEALLREKANNMNRTKILGNWRALLLSIPKQTYGTHCNTSPDSDPLRSADACLPSAPPPSPTPSKFTFVTSPTGWTENSFDLSDLDTVQAEGRAQPFFPATIMDAYFQMKGMASDSTPRVDTLHEGLVESEYSEDEDELKRVRPTVDLDSETFSNAHDSYDEYGWHDFSDGNLFVEETAFCVEAEVLSDPPRCSDRESLYSDNSEYAEDESSEEDYGFFSGIRRRGTVVAESVPPASSSNAWVQNDEPTQTSNDPPFFTDPWDSTAPSYLGSTPTTNSSLRVQPVCSRLAEEHARFFALAEERATAVRATEKIGPLDVDDSMRSNRVSSQPHSRPHRADFPREGDLTMETLIRATLHYQEHFKENVTSANVVTAISELRKHERRMRNADRTLAGPFIPFNE